MRFQALKRLWKFRAIRAVAAVMIFSAVLAFEYVLANIPKVVELQTIQELAPARIRLASEEMIIEEPVVNNPNGLLITHGGNPREFVDLYFDKARLDDETMEMLKSQDVINVPMGFEVIGYATARDDASLKPDDGETCRTSFRIKLDPQKPPSKIHFFQLGEAGTEQDRQIEVKASDAELLVSIGTDSPERKAPARGCNKVLKVGNRMIKLDGPFSINIIAAADSSLRFKFSSLDKNPSYWKDGFFSPFVFAAPRLLNDSTPLQMSRVSINLMGNKATATSPSSISIESADKQPTLSLSDIKVGADELRADMFGRGWVKINGKNLTVNLLELAQKSPLTVGALATLNTALFGWLVSIVFKKQKQRGKASRPSPFE